MTSPTGRACDGFLVDDGVHLYYEQHGPPDVKPSVVLLHGWSLDRRMWHLQIPGLSQDAGIIAYDARGHGRSGPIERQTATLDRLADDLATLLTTLAPAGRVVLAGHSLGGMTIMEYAHRHPAHFADHVRGAVLVSTTAEGARHAMNGFGAQMAQAARVGGRAGSWVLARAGLWRPYGVLSPVLRSSVRWLAFGEPARVEDVDFVANIVATTPLGTMGAFGVAVDTHDRLAELAALAHIPVTVLVGSRDRLTPLACATNIATALPQAKMVVCPGAGHMLPLERPNDVCEAVRLITTPDMAAPIDPLGQQILKPGEELHPSPTMRGLPRQPDVER